MEGIKIQMLYQALVLCMLVHLGYPQETAEGEGGLFYYHQSEYPKDCQDILNQCSNPDEIHDGVYIIKPEGLTEPIEVFCDQTTDNGGWTVIQRRIDGDIDFARGLDSYKNRFGFLNHEFWLGNEHLAYLTNQKEYTLRIDMEESRDAGDVGNVTYDWFRISDENSNYKLVKLEDFTDVSGTGFGDEMGGALSQIFSTTDSTTSCTLDGGWWYNDASCDKVNLNAAHDSLSWGSTAIKHVEMKVRPRRSS
ncbi:fibrinogen-like protein A isoform X1 [Apostichopus japonicus]|uniref:fibrinogen-like protein A isoform X1 n=1 Tax=Stichopus japonicus TaxID=307972 RepID=UPI003AB8031C